MKAILKLIFTSTFLVVLYEGAFSAIRSDYVLLNQLYTFPGNASGCHHAEWRKRSPIGTTIATYENHACTTERGFQEEFTCKDIHLLLKSAKYTDQGPYQFTCDGDKTSIILDVLYAQNASAVEMDNITLNCYAHNAEDVTWLHNNESVLLYKLGGSMNPGKGYEGRASLEKNCFKTGDLSLTIARVRKEDAGIYRCFVGDGTTKGYPHAYVLHVNGAFSAIRSDYVLLNQLYTFPGNTNGCHHAEWRKRSPIDTTITTYENHACTTERGFQEEFTCKDIHLLLKSAKYTDQGPYQFTCDGDKTPVNLDVLYAQNASAVEMDNITLNCYAHNAEDVTWLHNNESVLLYKLGGSMNPGKGYEGRASLEKNCFKTGDLSLTIARVRKEDAGIYRCFVGDGTTKGNPHAYVLHVNEKRSGPGDQTHSSCIFYKNFTIGLSVALSVILGISVAAFVSHLITKLRERQSTSATATQSSEDEANEREHMLMSVISTSTPTTESQSVDNHPVQESDSTGNKSSSTMPFYSVERGCEDTDI